MNFLYPTFLFLLGLIAIPVIIHFFNFKRYKTVYFSSLQFLFNIAKETRSRNRIKHLLVLLARILTIICLVFAFAQPFIPAKNNLKNNKFQTIAIYVDNSFSMNQIGTNGNLLEEAKNKAIGIVSSYSPSTNFELITNDLEPKHQHLLNRDQIIDYISAITTSPRTIKFSDIINRVKQIAKSANSLSTNICLLSDYQKHYFDFEKIENAPSTSIMLFPSTPIEIKNLSVDSCWFDYPEHNINQQEKLQVKIVNHSNESYQNIPVKLYLNDSIKTLSSFSISGNTSQTITLAYTNISKGSINGKIELADYPITYDNVYYFNYNVSNNVNIITINGTNKSMFLSKLFNNDSLFIITEMSAQNINFQAFPSNQVILLNAIQNISSGLQQEILTFVNKGGSLVFIPISNNDDNYKSFFSSIGINVLGSDSSKNQVSTLNVQSPFFKNVFQKIDDNPQYPQVNMSYKISVTKGNVFDDLILTRNQNPLFTSIKQNKGKIYLFLFPFDEKYTNFTTHPLFVPIMYRICELSKNNSDICYNISPTVNVNIINTTNGNEDILELKNHKTGESFIPLQNVDDFDISLLPGNQLIYDGLYDITYKNNILSSISFNYNRNESQNIYYTPTELEEILKSRNFKVSLFNSSNNESISNQIKNIETGKPLWKYFILLALLFVLAEIALIRLIKN